MHNTDNINNLNKNKKNKNFDFKCKKENAINSLFEVEHFLCSIKKICNAIDLYKILR